MSDGLPSSIVYDIETDDNGIVWIATFGSGLCRYDGETFKVINEDNGLPSDLVRCISLSNKNKMYVGSQGAYAIITPDSIYNKSKTLNDTLNPNVLFISVNQNTVQTGSNFGLITLVNDSVVRTIKSLQFISGYHKMLNGSEYFATRRGLFIIRPNGDIIDFNKTYHTDIKQITDLKMWNGIMLLSTSKGIFMVDGNNNVRHLSKKNGLQDDNIRCMVLDKNKTLWLGTATGLISTKNLVSFTKYDSKNGIDAVEIRCMAVDNNNILWIGTLSNGIYTTINANILKYELPNPVTAIAVGAQKQVYVLTNTSDLYKLNVDSNKFVKQLTVKTLLPGAGKQLSVDPLNNFYITVNNKDFIKVDPHGKERFLAKALKEIDNFSLYSFPYKNKVFLAFKRIVVVYDPLTNKMDTLHQRLKDTYFQDIDSDNIGNIWISSGKGLIKYDGKTVEQINNLTHQNFPGSVTNYLCADKYHNVWAATDKGLVCIEGKNVFSNYRKSGFESNELFGLQIIDTLLFASCNKGLIQLNIKRNGNANNNFILINEKFGLAQPDLTNKTIVSDDENIWIGGINAVFKYKAVGYNTKLISRLFISDVIKDSVSLTFKNKKNYLQNFVDTSTTLNLNYKENDFTIHCVSINHQRLRDEFFIHRLLGLTNVWSVPTTDPKATYTNLNPGSYVFELMVVGHPKEKIKLKIVISPPFYKTVWFLFIVIAVISFLLYAFFQARLQSIKNQNMVLESKVAKRTLELNNKTTLLSETNFELSKKNKLITESLEYAKKIQESILPSQHYLKQQFSAVITASLYLPKDIVSGDFFYANKKNAINYFAVVDCTGHGVPGALLSFSINSILHGIIEGIDNMEKPSVIIKELLKKFGEIYIKGQDVKESFAISLIAFNTDAYKILVSTVSQSVLFSTSNSTEEIKTSSSFLMHDDEKITDVEIAVKPGDRLFLYSDGYYDQKSDASKKRMYKSTMIREIVSTRSALLDAQITHLNDFYMSFKGMHEQIDDVTVFAIEIS